MSVAAHFPPNPHHHHHHYHTHTHTHTHTVIPSFFSSGLPKVFLGPLSSSPTSTTVPKSECCVPERREHTTVPPHCTLGDKTATLRPPPKMEKPPDGPPPAPRKKQPVRSRLPRQGFQGVARVLNFDQDWETPSPVSVDGAVSSNSTHPPQAKSTEGTPPE